MFLETSSNQFGFKKRSSTIHAIHCLKGTIDYYVNNGSRVFCGFLDVSKAFDRIVHAGLFLKMIKRKVPFLFLIIIISWYIGLDVVYDGKIIIAIGLLSRQEYGRVACFHPIFTAYMSTT